MPLPKLLLPPDQSGYQVNFGVTSVSVQLEGGASRFRADQLGAACQLPVQWRLGKRNFNYLNAFYRTAITLGADPFLIDLMIDSGDMVEYTAHILPGTFQLTAQSGATWVMAATLEVISAPIDSDADNTIITAGPE